MTAAQLHAGAKRRSGLRAQRGLSLVELMVGIAVGMFIVAAATLMVSSQLSGNRQLLLETQVQQDLRAASDIVTRELRRSGALRLNDAHAGIATPTLGPQENAQANVLPLAGASSTVDFSYVRAATETGPYGFRLTGGVLESRQGAGGWQQLTDPNTMVVTAFSVTADHEPAVVLACHRLCTGGTTDCWPQLRVRRFTVDISARAANDPQVQRQLRSTVRLRNDDLVFRNPDDTGPVCP